MKLTHEEQETVIRASAADEEWDIWTCDPRIIRLLERRGYTPKPDHQQSKGGNALSVKIPFGRVSILGPKAKLTDEQRSARDSRLKPFGASTRINVSDSSDVVNLGMNDQEENCLVTASRETQRSNG